MQYYYLFQQFQAPEQIQSQKILRPMMLILFKPNLLLNEYEILTAYRPSKIESYI